MSVWRSFESAGWAWNSPSSEECGQLCMKSLALAPSLFQNDDHFRSPWNLQGATTWNSRSRISTSKA